MKLLFTELYAGNAGDASMGDDAIRRRELSVSPLLPGHWSPVIQGKQNLVFLLFSVLYVSS